MGGVLWNEMTTDETLRARRGQRVRARYLPRFSAAPVPIATLNSSCSSNNDGGWFYLIPGYASRSCVSWSRTCAPDCAHIRALLPSNPCFSLSLVYCSCVIRRVPQRCITEWRESRRNALPAHKSRHATSPVCRVTCAHATWLLSLSLSLSLPGPYGLAADTIGRSW